MAKGDSTKEKTRTRFWVKESPERILLYEETTCGHAHSLRTYWTAREPYESTACVAWNYKALLAREGEIPAEELEGAREIGGEEAAVLLASGIPGEVALRRAAQILAAVPPKDPLRRDAETCLRLLAEAAGTDPRGLAPHPWLVQLLAPEEHIAPDEFWEPSTTLSFDAWLDGEARELRAAGWSVTIEPFGETLSLVQAGPHGAGEYPGVFMRWLMPEEAAECISGW